MPFDPNAEFEIVKLPQAAAPVAPKPRVSPVADGRAAALSVFPGLEITDNVRDPTSRLGMQNPGSWHNRSKAAIDARPIPGLNFQQYVQKYKDAGYEILDARDEVSNPAPWATGPHWHVVLGGGPTGEAPVAASAAPEDAPVPEFNPEGGFEVVDLLTGQVEPQKDARQPINTDRKVTVEAPNEMEALRETDKQVNEAGYRYVSEDEKYRRNMMRAEILKAVDNNEDIESFAARVLAPLGVDNPTNRASVKWYLDAYKNGWVGDVSMKPWEQPKTPEGVPTIQNPDPLSFTEKVKLAFDTESGYAGYGEMAYLKRRLLDAMNLNDAFDAQNRPGMTKEEREAERDREALSAIEYQRGNYEYQMGQGNQASAFIARLVGETGGNLNPLDIIAPGKSIPVRIAAQGAVNAGLDVAAQAGQVSEGLKDEMSPTQTAIAGLAGAGLQGIGELAGMAIKTATKRLGRKPSSFEEITTEDIAIADEEFRRAVAERSKTDTAIPSQWDGGYNVKGLPETVPDTRPQASPTPSEGPVGAPVRPWDGGYNVDYGNANFELNNPLPEAPRGIPKGQEVVAKPLPDTQALIKKVADDLGIPEDRIPQAMKERDFRLAVESEALHTGHEPNRTRDFFEALDNLDAVKTRVDEIRSVWANAPETTVVSSVDELPANVRKKIGKTGEEAYGFVVDGNHVYVMGQNVKPEQVASVMFHESLGHVGLRNKYGAELNNVLTELYRTSAFLREEVAKWRQDYGAEYKSLYRNPKTRLAREVEEVLAKMSEAGYIEPKLWQRIKNFILTYARKAGYKGSLKESEIREILRQAHKTVVYGEDIAPNQAKGRQATRFMYVGPRASGSRKLDERGLFNKDERLKEAQTRMAAGEKAGPKSQIRKDTGWFYVEGDKGWRREISDEDADLMPRFDQLAKENKSKAFGDPVPSDKFGNTFAHPELFNEYPELKDINVTREPYPNDWTSSVQGWFDKESNTLNVTPYATDPVGTALHEVQHAIQKIEGWSSGSNKKSAIFRYPIEKLTRIMEEVGEAFDNGIEAIDVDIHKINTLASDPVVMQAFDDYKQGTIARSEARKIEDGDESWVAIKAAMDVQDAAKKKLANQLGFERIYDVPIEERTFLYDLLARANNSSIPEILSDLDTQKGVLALQKKEVVQAAVNGDREALVKALEKADKKAGVDEALWNSYEFSHGEIEARDTTARKSMTKEQRQETNPYDSEKHIPAYWRTYSRKTDRPASEILSETIENDLYETETRFSMPKPERKENTAGLKNLSSSRQIEDLLRETAEGVSKSRVSHEDTVALAKFLGVNVKKLLKLNPNMTPEMAVASRYWLMQSADRVVKLTKRAMRDNGTRADLENMRMAILQHTALQEKVQGLASNAGRVLNAYKIAVHQGDWNATQKAAQRLLKNTDMSLLGNDDYMMALGRTLMDAEDPDVANAIIRQAHQPYWEDWIISGRQSMMLFGWKTHVKNMVGNALSISLDNWERVVASVIGRMRGAKPEDRYSATQSMLRPIYMLESLFEAQTWKDAKTSWANSHPVHSVSKYEHGNTVFTGAAAPIQYPYKGLAAEDSIFRSMLENANYREMAYMQAKKERATGQLGSDMEFWTRVDELRKNPTEEMIKESSRETAILQYVDENSAFGEVLSKAKRRPKPEEHGKRVVRFMLNYFLPFTNVADRLLWAAIRRIPVLGFFDRVNLEDLKAGGKRADLAIARQALGATMLGMYFGMAQQGNLIGSENNQDKRNMLEARGLQPNSVKINGTWRSLAGLDQLGVSMGLAANLHKYFNDPEATEEGKIEKFVSGVGQIGNLIGQQTYLKQLGEFVSLIGTGPIQESARENFIANQATSFLPNFLRQYNQTTDKAVRDTTGDGGWVDKTQGKLMSVVPGLDDNLPQRYDMFGKPVERQGDTLHGLLNKRTESNDPTVKEIYRLGVDANEGRPILSVPNRGDLDDWLNGRDTPKSQKKPVDAALLQEYAKIAGERVKKALDKFVASDSYKGMDDARRIKMVKKIAERERRIAKRELKKPDEANTPEFNPEGGFEVVNLEGTQN